MAHVSMFLVAGIVMALPKEFAALDIRADIRAFQDHIQEARAVARYSETKSPIFWAWVRIGITVIIKLIGFAFLLAFAIVFIALLTGGLRNHSNDS